MPAAMVVERVIRANAARNRLRLRDSDRQCSRVSFPHSLSCPPGFL
jgi:hypothetical protein